MSEKTGSKKVVSVLVAPFQVVLIPLFQAVLPVVLLVDVHNSSRERRWQKESFPSVSVLAQRCWVTET